MKKNDSRKENCPHCNKELTRKYIKQHLKICKGFDDKLQWEYPGV